jgi:hypothetical protein
MPWFKNTMFVITLDHAATFSGSDQYLLQDDGVRSWRCITLKKAFFLKRI